MTLDDTWYADEAATFGDRLAAAREGAGMEVADLAGRLGVRDTTVEAWEQDQADPRANRVQMLAGILNVSLIWLLSGKGPGVPAPAEGGSDLADLRAEVQTLRLSVLRTADRIARLDRAILRACEAA